MDPSLNRLSESALTSIYRAALAAVDPESAVRRSLRESQDLLAGYANVWLVGFGKAAAPMARAVEQSVEQLKGGVVIVKDGHTLELAKTRIFEASHPEPDERGVRATADMVAFLQEAVAPEDLVIVVISGGGSALSPAPVEGISLADKKKTTTQLLGCGATIQEINTLRKHLSRIKGGRLLDYCNGARVVALILSDVVGDDLSSIASGPTVPDPTTFQDCLSIVQNYRLEERIPESVLDYLRAGAKGGINSPAETPKEEDPRFANVENILVGSNIRALQAAAKAARDSGYSPLILSSRITGDTRAAARLHVSLAEEVLASGNPLEPPCCLISGGETTVNVSGDGKGGRNMEFTLWCAYFARHWAPSSSVLFASIGTDGTDGPTDAAGAFADPLTCQKAEARGLSAQQSLERNDSYHFFKQMGNLIVTGPTLTNVMDLHIVLIS